MLKPWQHAPARPWRRRFAEQCEQGRHDIVDRGLLQHAPAAEVVWIVDDEKAGRRLARGVHRRLTRAGPGLAVADGRGWAPAGLCADRQKIGRDAIRRAVE